ncbi:hypothetical protein [Pseudomarimonas salicorniae]|uniref:Uncharacterized protein n=1 Tax=Pseudomarimonas salicorniae TaxID=2933270 RepID=A0ABT0GEY3_9GAMM|nr:hypothetical protein [Lysobacter sp. CAU 1642]MCK7593107.1 hypothetical protein [Lysobacter sp. CAU 1642]
MADQERRSGAALRLAMLKQELNPEQLETLRELEMFGWELKFIRHRPFQDVTPVVFDGDRRSFAVIRSDGTLEQNPPMQIRH